MTLLVGPNGPLVLWQTVGNWPPSPKLAVDSVLLNSSTSATVSFELKPPRSISSTILATVESCHLLSFSHIDHHKNGGWTTDVAHWPKNPSVGSQLSRWTTHHRSFDLNNYSLFSMGTYQVPPGHPSPDNLHSLSFYGSTYYT